MSQSKKIMIADDDAAILDSVSLMLEFEGYTVSYTLYGESVLTMEEQPDLLLLDIWMSGVDGRNICRQLKQQEATRNMPVVLISASNDIQNSAIEAGADDFLAKPFDMDELVEKIKKNLRKDYEL